MTNEVREIVEGDGYAVAHIDALGEPYGFRKIRRGLNVTAFGINAVVMPAGYATGRHYHDEQEETYFVHRGQLEFEFGDGSKHLLGPGAADSGQMIAEIRAVADAALAAYDGADGTVRVALNRFKDMVTRLGKALPESPDGASDASER